MNQPINLKRTNLPIRNLIRPATTRCGFVLVIFAVASFALSSAPTAFGVSPAPDGGYPNNNTAEGTNALKNLSTFSSDNTAIGFQALFSNTDGQFNTATGSSALVSNTTGNFNTATGESALVSNTTGGQNTATGESALVSNTTGHDNTASGYTALLFNTTGNFNTATGSLALGAVGNNNTATGYAALCGGCTSEVIPTGNNNTATGANALINNNGADNNTATGFNALASNTTGTQNTANGVSALLSNATSNKNTAEGFQALLNTTGSNNIGLGANAGIDLTTGNNNIDIGAHGTAGESNTIRIGSGAVHKAAYMGGISGATVAGGVGVIVDKRGHLGTVQSSARFKDEIKPMDKASEAILALKPVTFRYKKELDPDGIPQFGLMAEQVEKINPDLVARDENGQVSTVRYEAVNAMLLNEFLKEHRKVKEQDRQIRVQEATITQLRDEMATVVARLKEQDSKIQKVTDQLELNKPVRQVIATNP